jgi:hypothetical protein
MSVRVKSPQEYVDLVKQTIYELEDILEASGFDVDTIDSNTRFVEILLKELRELRASMADGSYQFGRNDLPFMRIVKKCTEKELPCIRLFYRINQTHREGLDVTDS